jgi:hypothetical protein
MTERKARASATTRARATTKANTGVLHFVQDDDEKQTTARVTTTATASAKTEADPYGMTTRKAKSTTALDGVEGLAAVDGFG